MRPRPPRTRRFAGFTLIEAMLLLVIFSIVAVATAAALRSLANVPSAGDVQLAIDDAMIDKMEQLKAIPFDSIAVGTSYSDTVTIKGVSYARSVTVASASANPPSPPAPPGPPPKAPPPPKGGPPPPPPPPPAPPPDKGKGPPAPPAPPPVDYLQITLTVDSKTWVTYLSRP